MSKEFTSFAKLKRFLQEQRIKDLGIRPVVTLNAMDETEAKREQALEEVIEAIHMMPGPGQREMRTTERTDNEEMQHLPGSWT